ncbi:hypothetical protein [Streptomyces sp. CO7]
MRTRKALRAVATVGLVLGAVGATAGSAHAAGKDGWLTSGEMGFFCGTGQTDAVFDLYLGDSNFADDSYKGAQPCAGEVVAGNTRSLLNLDSYEWSIHTDANAGGVDGYVPVGYGSSSPAALYVRSAYPS